MIDGLASGDGRCIVALGGCCDPSIDSTGESIARLLRPGECEPSWSVVDSRGEIRLRAGSLSASVAEAFDGEATEDLVSRLFLFLGS